MKAPIAFLALQAVITFATAAMMFIAPGAIPGTFGIHISAEAYTVCYLFGAEKFTMGVLSLAAMRIRVAATMRDSLLSFAAFHAAVAGAAIYGVLRGAPTPLLANGVAHAVLTIIFIAAMPRIARTRVLMTP